MPVDSTGKNSMSVCGTATTPFQQPFPGLVRLKVNTAQVLEFSCERKDESFAGGNIILFQLPEADLRRFQPQSFLFRLAGDWSER